MRAGQTVVEIKADVALERDQRWGQWMTAAQDGDRAAYERLLRDCAPFIRRIAARSGLRDDRADDAVQETLLTLHKARQTYDPARSFSAWLATIAQRRAIDILRSTGRTKLREVHAPEAYDSHTDEARSADADLEVSDSVRQVHGLLDKLSPLQREAVEHLALREQSLQEAAEVTGRSVGALKVNLHRALKSLRGRFGAGEVEP